MKCPGPMLTPNATSILALSLLFAACGKSTKNHRDGKRPDETKTESPAEVAPPGGVDGDGNQGNPTPDDGAANPKFDESILRTSALHYYQWDSRLKDLFSPDNATSQLCWPASLASEIEYLRTRKVDAVAELPEIATGVDKYVEETRHFTALCKTDKTTGTTVIQGVKCIDDYLKSAQLTADVEVSGVDAQWGTLGFFPTGTTSVDGPISPARLRDASANDTSVLLLVGYYSKESDGTYKRTRGHFVAVNGFDYQRAWGDDSLVLHVMNPAESPTGVSPAEVLEVVELKRLSADGNWPDDVAFELIGKHFGEGSHKALVESSIEFTVRR